MRTLFSQNLDRKYLTMLVNTNYFTDYVELILLEERHSLPNPVIFNFLATFMSKVRMSCDCIMIPRYDGHESNVFNLRSTTNW